MKIIKLREAGYEEALLGLGLNKKLTSDYNSWDEVPVEVRSKLFKVADKLCCMDGGHNKFLESIQVWMLVDMPLFAWKQMDTYRVGTSKQSESTMHTLMKNEIMQADFEKEISQILLDNLNNLRETGDFETLNNELPQGYMQRRVMNTNYKALRNIYLQRRNHKLGCWKEFCEQLLHQLDYKELLTNTK